MWLYIKTKLNFQQLCNQQYRLALKERLLTEKALERTKAKGVGGYIVFALVQDVTNLGVNNKLIRL